MYTWHYWIGLAGSHSGLSLVVMFACMFLVIHVYMLYILRYSSTCGWGKPSGINRNDRREFKKWPKYTKKWVLNCNTHQMKSYIILYWCIMHLYIKTIYTWKTAIFTSCTFCYQTLILIHNLLGKPAYCTFHMANLYIRTFLSL